MTMKYNYILMLFLLLTTKAISQKVLLNENFEKDNQNWTYDKDGFKVYFEKGGMVLENDHEKSTK